MFKYVKLFVFVRITFLRLKRSEAYSGPFPISAMEMSAKVLSNVNLKPLTNHAKWFISDAWQSSEYTSAGGCNTVLHIQEVISLTTTKGSIILISFIRLKFTPVYCLRTT